LKCRTPPNLMCRNVPVPATSFSKLWMAELRSTATLFGLVFGSGVSMYGAIILSTESTRVEVSAFFQVLVASQSL
jgi:hypothetical protein